MTIPYEASYAITPDEWKALSAIEPLQARIRTLEALLEEAAEALSDADTAYKRIRAALTAGVDLG